MVLLGADRGHGFSTWRVVDKVFLVTGAGRSVVSERRPAFTVGTKSKCVSEGAERPTFNVDFTDGQGSKLLECFGSWNDIV